jgi:hypothetical protein
MQMHGAEKSIREIADKTGMTESAVKSRVSVLTMKMKEAVQNPFVGVLRGATSGGNRNYDRNDLANLLYGIHFVLLNYYFEVFLINRAIISNNNILVNNLTAAVIKILQPIQIYTN